MGYYDRKFSPENRYGLDFSYDINDYFSFDIYAGSSINDRKFFFVGSTFSTVISF
ncbi:MAG TPA: hypothetical protein VIK14_04215 [Ignavibacteria bacterium]